ncbi:hypothetical protein [Mesorhizobium sp. M0185]|uniref:hypothetical protein n=1 Tax=unclassified Mesorhizobium TaxID=325217 RepID=UPI0033389B98
MPAFVLFCLLSEMSAASEFEKPSSTLPAQQAIERLLPNSVLRVGMPRQELEEVIRSRYPDWERSEKKRALNNRKDMSLSLEARSAYLQTISISHEEKEQNLIFRYRFALTSPLTGSHVYSIVYGVESNTSNLISIDDWANGLHSRWGDEHGGTRSDAKARATYFFDTEWRLVENAGNKCAPIYPALYRLDEKTVGAIAAVSSLLDATGCTFSRDSILEIKEGAVVQSTFYTVDFRLQVNDVLKRVAFGLQ